MPTPPHDMVQEVHLSDKGLEAVSPQNRGKVAGGFGDTKKVLILVGLGVVAAGVVAYQFVGGSGPTPAEAKATEPPEPTAAAEIVESLLNPGEPPAAESNDDGLSVERVEDLVREFDTYVQQRQVPVSALRVNPFVVAQVAMAKATEEEIQGQSDAEAEAEARRRQILQAAENLKLGSVLIAGNERTAVIQGRVYHVGDIVEGMRVAAIAPTHVALTYEGETVTLRLHPENPMH